MSAKTFSLFMIMRHYILPMVLLHSTDGVLPCSTDKENHAIYP